MDIEAICRDAWNVSKRSHQPSYDALIPAYRDRLTALAEGVLVTGTVLGGPDASFEMSVITIAAVQSHTAITIADELPIMETLSEPAPEPVKSKPVKKVVKKKVEVKKPAVKVVKKDVGKKKK